MRALVTLRRERDTKISEISAIEHEIAVLTDDIQSLKADGADRQSTVRRINNMLKAKYAEFRRQYPIDRDQERKITRFISKMESSVLSATSSYDSGVSLELSKIRFVRYSSMRDPKLTPYKNRMRDMVKNHIVKLKSLFDEVNCATEDFCKSNISLSSIQSLIRIMQTIWNSGKSVTITINSQIIAQGSMPVRYQSKIDKWKSVARDIPEDIEAMDREREDIEKRIMLNKLNSAQSAVNDLEKKLSALQSNLERQEIALAQLNSTLKAFEARYDLSKAEIIRNSDSKLQSIQDCICQLQNKQTELLSKKHELEVTLAKAFVLALRKKKEVRMQIATVASAISAAAEDELTQESELTKERERKKKQILELQSELADLREKTKKATAQLNVTKEEIKSTSCSLDAKKESIPALKKAVDDFHSDYLIHTFGKLVDPTVLIADKQKKIDQLQETVMSLRQEVVDLEKRIKAEELESFKKTKKYATRSKVPDGDLDLRLLDIPEDGIDDRLEDELDNEQTPSSEETDESYDCVFDDIDPEAFNDPVLLVKLLQSKDKKSS